jgi:outer membrane murein-binding lipoprotein Lpp
MEEKRGTDWNILFMRNIDEKKALIVMVLLISVTFLAGCGGVSQEKFDAALADKDTALAQVTTLQSSLTTVNAAKTKAEADLATAQAALTKADSDLASTTSQLSVSKAQVATLAAQVTTLTAQVATLEKQVTELKTAACSLTIDGKPFRFIGNNSIYFGYYREYGWNIEDAITAASQNGMKVIRIYLWFGDRPWAGVLEDMDMVLNIAAINGVYVIPVITDLCPFRSDVTKEEYFRVLPHGDLASQSALDSLKSLINTILNRKNTINGRVYKNDTIILAWDVANEPVLRYFTPSIIHDWLNKVTTYIKSLDQNHLVTFGVSGWQGDVFDQDRAYYEALNVPGLDFFSFHMYPPQGYSPPAMGKSDKYLDAIKARTNIFISMGKPVVLEEFGFTSYRQLVANLGREPNETELQQWLKVYKDQMDAAFSAGASGTMFWGWGVPDTKSVPLWWQNEDHDVTEKEFCAMIKNYVIPVSVNK